MWCGRRLYNSVYSVHRPQRWLPDYFFFLFPNPPSNEHLSRLPCGGRVSKPPVDGIGHAQLFRTVERSHTVFVRARDKTDRKRNASDFRTTPAPVSTALAAYERVPPSDRGRAVLRLRARTNIPTCATTPVSYTYVARADRQRLKYPFREPRSGRRTHSECPICYWNNETQYDRHAQARAVLSDRTTFEP